MKDYDPFMHTAEHVLNQTMVQMFGCERAFSSHLERKKSKVDYRFDRDLLDVEKSELAERVNAILKQNLPVTVTMMPIDEARQIFNLSRLPESVTDDLRIVKVGYYDSCPCIGDHVQNTSEVGNFALVSSSFADGVLRLRFKLNK